LGVLRKAFWARKVFGTIEKQDPEQSREATNSPDDGGNLEAGESSHQRGEEQVNLPPPYFLSQFLPPP